MKRLFFILSVLLAFSANVFAAYVAVLETGADGSAKESVSLSDRQYLTNVLREQAVLELPAVQNYTIMTRENIQQMKRERISLPTTFARHVSVDLDRRLRFRQNFTKLLGTSSLQALTAAERMSKGFWN